MNSKRSLTGLWAAAVMMAALLLSGCQSGQENIPGPQEQLPTETIAVETVPTEPTEPPPTCPPDGNPDDVTCQGSYTADTKEMAQSAKQIVATIGEQELSNALLQIYYRMAVNSYRAAGHEISPDFSKPLDVQLFQLEGDAITWQQYFLQQALNSWQSHVAMVQASKTAQLPLEEAYGRDEKEHEKYQISNIYNLGLLYGYNTDYVISDAHQEYLNNLPTLLEELAAANGCATPAALANDLAGIGTNDTYLLAYAQLLNEGYMYMTTLSYYIEPTAAEVEAYFQENEEAYAEMGITRENAYINLRHILLVPENATVAEDGTVTASEESWSDCEEDAKSLLKKWKKNKTEANFAELAFANSDDTGSSVNGGLYSNLSKGQLMQELDTWCFDEARKTGDVEIIRTALGYHIVYLAAPSQVWYEQAEVDLITQLLHREIASAAQNHPMTVDYSAIRLGTPGSDTLQLSADDLLYPDIAHERYPAAPLYFQQDYPNTMYGNYPLVRYGCGVTTMSMLVTYMTDEEWTPPELCALYGSYCGAKGTAHSMFTEVPVDRGFYCVERVYTWSEALKALEDGYLVVSLQRDGYWTNGGHYLLLHNLIEAENDEGVVETRIQVRDSNVKNYKKLKGHTTGSFALSTIPPNSRCYWIYQKKVTNLDSCVRCAEPTEESHAPSALFAQDYVCPKCQEALLRRSSYLDGCANLMVLPGKEEAVPEETVASETTATEVAATETVTTEAATEVPTETQA